MLQQMRSAAKYIWIFLIIAFVGGFLVVQTSGLMSRSTITPTTAVASVNGEKILYTDYENRAQSEVQSEQQRTGRTLSEDEIQRIRNDVFDQMVRDILLRQEYDRRGIVVTDQEVQSFALSDPPPWIRQAPDLQTDGQFDPQKYRRLLGSSYAKQSGLQANLEQYFRSQIPQYKLLNQLQSSVYVTDSELWRMWQDQHDSAQVSFVAFPPKVDTSGAMSDRDLQDYFDKHKDEFKRVGRAWLTVVALPRTVSAQDSAAVRQKAIALRNEIASGAKFEDIAKRESADSGSAAQGGDLGKAPQARYVPAFSAAAAALKVGELSQPVLTQFGYHLIRLDSRSGDTLGLHHILLRIEPSDSAQTQLDRRADELSRRAAQSPVGQGAKLDTAAKQLSLTPFKVAVIENEPAQYQGRTIPSVSAWAFSGVRATETSELFSDESGYYLARLDSLSEGGDPTFENVKAEVRRRVALDKGLDAVIPAAKQLASTAAASTLESAAAAQKLAVQHSPVFSRGTFVPGLGQFNEAIGTAFGLPVGAVSAPVRTADAVVVLRVDRRTRADSASFVAQIAQQRQGRLQALQNQRVQMFLLDLRQNAKIEDNRKEINAALRRGGTA